MRGAHDGHDVDRKPGGPAGLVVAHAEARRIVDQHVDAAERRAGFGHVTLHRWTVGQVADRGVRPVAFARRSQCVFFPALRLACADGHAGARRREAKRDRAADAAAAAGDDDALARKSKAMPDPFRGSLLSSMTLRPDSISRVRGRRRPLRPIMLTMRRTVAVGVRMCTGCAAPSRIGPTVMPPPAVTRSRLKAILAASSVRHDQQVGLALERRIRDRPCRAPRPTAPRRPCISPSTSRSGAARANQVAALRASFALTASCRLPKLECDSSATFGVMPKRRTSSAASIVISATCSAVGSAFT